MAHRELSDEGGDIRVLEQGRKGVPPRFRARQVLPANRGGDSEERSADVIGLNCAPITPSGLSDASCFLSRQRPAELALSRAGSFLTDRRHLPAVVVAERACYTSKPGSKKDRPGQPQADRPLQNLNEFGDHWHGALPSRLNPPTELGFSPNMQPSVIEVDVLNEQAGRLAGTNPRLGECEMNRKTPPIGGLQELLLSLLIENEDALRFVL